jgi:hypothetical protein
MPPRVEARAAGSKKAPVPPPLPKSLTTKKEPVPGGLPPLPPKVPGGPPAPPGTAGTVAGAVINRVVGSLVQALCVRKLGFFLLAATSIGLFLLLLSYGLVRITMPSESLNVENLDSLIGDFMHGIILIVIIAVGLVGVLTGGVAYLTHMEEQGRSVGIRDAFRFCGSRFGSLFVGAVLFLILVLLVFGVTNGFIMILSSGHPEGSLLAALLFLPHFVLNLVLILAAVISVIIPCSITVENIGPVVAISRFIACVRRDTGRLVVHFIITAFFSFLVMIMVNFVFVVLFFTFLINAGIYTGIPGPSLLFGRAGIQQSFDVEFASRDSHNIIKRLDTNSFQDRRVSNILFEPSIGRSSHNRWIMQRNFDIRRPNLDIFDQPEQIKIPWNVKLRLFFAALVIASAVSYGVVFWIVSFTNYYRAVRPKISIIAPPRRASP